MSREACARRLRSITSAMGRAEMGLDIVSWAAVPLEARSPKAQGRSTLRSTPHLQQDDIMGTPSSRQSFTCLGALVLALLACKQGETEKASASSASVAPAAVPSAVSAPEPPAPETPEPKRVAKPDVNEKGVRRACRNSGSGGALQKCRQLRVAALQIRIAAAVAGVAARRDDAGGQRI